jgi:AmiR/NasT family two-component response regulator
VIDRAKAMHIDSQDLKEREAFRKIQVLAMNTWKPMRAVAEANLLAAALQV